MQFFGFVNRGINVQDLLRCFNLHAVVKNCMTQTFYKRVEKSIPFVGVGFSEFSPQDFEQKNMAPKLSTKRNEGRSCLRFWRFCSLFFFSESSARDKRRKKSTDLYHFVLSCPTIKDNFLLIPFRTSSRLTGTSTGPLPQPQEHIHSPHWEKNKKMEISSPTRVTLLILGSVSHLTKILHLQTKHTIGNVFCRDFNLHILCH